MTTTTKSGTRMAATASPSIATSPSATNRLPREPGPSAVSEPEHRALADFLFDRTNIAAVFCFSPDDNLFHPWKPDKQAEGARIKTTVLSADAPALEFLAADYKKLHGGKDAPESAEARGSFASWAYFHYGRWSLAARGWWIPQVEPPKPKPAEGAEEKEKKPSGENAARTTLMFSIGWTGKRSTAL